MLFYNTLKVFNLFLQCILLELLLFEPILPELFQLGQLLITRRELCLKTLQFLGHLHQILVLLIWHGVRRLNLLRDNDRWLLFDHWHGSWFGFLLRLWDLLYLRL